MKSVQLRFLFLFSFLLLGCSFIIGLPILNGNNYSKQFWIEFLLSAYGAIGIGIILLAKKSIKLHFTKSDILIICLLLVYWISVILQGSSPLVKNVPIYYGLYYFISKLVLNNFELGNIKIGFSFFLILVPFTNIIHVLLLLIQLIRTSVTGSENFAIGSTFFNPDMLGSYLAVLFPFCFMQVRFLKIIGLGTFILGFSALLFIQSRTSIVAVFSMGFVWLLINKRFKIKTIIKIGTILLFLLFLLIAWHPESVFGRFFLWYASLKMIVAKPLGWGLLAFEKDFPIFQADILSNKPNIIQLFSPQVVHSPFNEFLNIGVTLGIIGLVLICILFFLVFKQLIRTKNILTYPILAFFVISLFYFPFKISPLMALVIPIVAWVTNNDPSCYKVNLNKINGKILLFLLLLISAIGGVKALTLNSCYKQWQDAYLITLGKKSGKEAEPIFLKLYPKFRADGRFLITYSNLIKDSGNIGKAVELLEEASQYFCDIGLSLGLAQLYETQGLYDKAEENYDLAILLSPGRYTAAYKKILFLNRIGRTDEAIAIASKLLKMPIEDSQFAETYVIIGRLRKMVRDSGYVVNN